MDIDNQITVTKSGVGYALGWTSSFCGVWKINTVTGMPTYIYPPTPVGWKNACSKFEELEDIIDQYTSLNKQQQSSDADLNITKPFYQTQPLQTNVTLSDTAIMHGATAETTPVEAIPSGSFLDKEATLAGDMQDAASKYDISSPVVDAAYVDAGMGKAQSAGLPDYNYPLQKKADNDFVAKSGSRISQLVGASVLLVGLIVGVTGLFPTYLTSETLVSTGYNLTPHIFYLAVWAIAAIMIFSSETLSTYGSLFALGVSLISFGLFVTDIATGIEGSYIGPGLALSISSWLLCTGGAAIVYFFLPKNKEKKFYLSLPSMLISAAVALAIAILYIPSWDSYTIIKLTTGQSLTRTAGDAFQLPAPLIAGALAVSVAFAAMGVYVFIFARTKRGYIFFFGGFLVILGQVISAFIQQTNPYTANGITKSAAAASGIQITAGFTPMFYALVIAMIVLAALLLSEVTSSVNHGNLPGATVPPGSYLSTRPGEQRLSMANNEDFDIKTGP